MTHKKRNIIIISAVSAVLVLASVFLSLGLTIWRPKTTEEWLNDFSSALVIKQNQSDRKTEKTIVISEGGAEVARYYQLVEVHMQGGRPVAHLIAKENFLNLGTTEFDTYDEYYFYDDTMYMRRENGGEITNTKFSSTWDVFWEVVSENMGKNAYHLEKDVLADLELTHDGGVHTLNANISDEKKETFFGKTENTNDMSAVSLNMQIDDVPTLISFKLSYTFKTTQNVTIEINALDPTEIVIDNFQTQIN